MNQKSELGKGLKALLSNINAEEKIRPVSIGETAANSISFIPISQIIPNRSQPRKGFDEEQLLELAESIKTYGIIQPITVREIGKGEFQIISGERRFRAAQLAKLNELPCFVRKANDSELLELALVENIQREDLNPMEVAISYQRLIEELNYTQEKLADRIGKKRSTISNYIRLLKLPTEIQTALKSKQMSMGHARVLAGIDNPILQLQLFKDIQHKDLSVRAAESWSAPNSDIAKGPKGHNHLLQSTNAEIQSIQNRLSSKLGVKISIQRNAKGEGKIIIPFKNDQAFNDVLDRLEE